MQSSSHHAVAMQLSSSAKQLKERNLRKNAQKIAEADSKERAKKTVQKMKLVAKEIITCQTAQMKRRAANLQRSETQNGDPENEREKPKLKIPSLEEGESSATYNSSDLSDSDSDDSIPPVNWEF